MRGAQTPPRAEFGSSGIIPADVGSTQKSSAWWIENKDHPRGCGEHTLWCRRQWSELGSSPRMRGALSLVLSILVGDGIIPADAGSTGRRLRRWEHGRDHPRGCGEHITSEEQSQFPAGSSPRMRGALPTNWISTWRQRIIPADAGSTKPSTRQTTHSQDHPRGCGEHVAPALTSDRYVGSSPRMRGALSGAIFCTIPVRIIPADAGSTSAWLPIATRHGDHPRGCGEHNVLYK